MMKVKNFLATVMAAVMVTGLLPCGNITAQAEIKTVRNVLTGEYVQIDTNNVAHAEDEKEEEVSFNIKKESKKEKPWVKKDGKKYVPITDRYTRPVIYDDFLEKTEKYDLIVDKKVGTLYTADLSMILVADGDTVDIHLLNSGKKKTGLRMYCHQDKGTLRVFVDTDDQHVAYSSIEIGSKKIRAAEMETEKIGLENLNVKKLTSTNGTEIGPDKNGIIKKNEQIKITLTLK